MRLIYRVTRRLVATGALDPLIRVTLRAWIGDGGRFTRERSSRLARTFLRAQQRWPGSGIGGISFIEPRQDGTSEDMSDRKIASFLRNFHSLNDGARTKAVRLCMLDLLKGIEKRSLERRLPESHRWQSRLKCIFLSGFESCNLDCAGCYACEKRPATPRFSDLDDVVAQAKRLGIFFVHVVGRGEPFFSREDKEILFRLAEKHQDLRFTVLTNGTLIQDSDVERMARCGNVIPFVSVDGLEEINDARRGTGVFAAVMRAFQRMNRHRLIHCFSTTVHRSNYEHVTSPEFIDTMIESGNRLGIFCQYDPIGSEVDREMRLTERDRERYRTRLSRAQERSEIPLRDQTFLEEARGYQARLGRSVYIDGLTGAVTPCFKTPFAPADCNLFENGHPGRLLEILGSPFFRRYRNEYVHGRQCFTHRDTELSWFAATLGSAAPPDRPTRRSALERHTLANPKSAAAVQLDGMTPLEHPDRRGNYRNKS